MRRRLVAKLAVLGLTLCITAALASPKTVCAVGFCESCAQNCRNDSLSFYLQCRADGGSVEYCDHLQEIDNKVCQDMFCSGCPFVPL